MRYTLTHNKWYSQILSENEANINEVDIRNKK